jgi:hypothetical protein
MEVLEKIFGSAAKVKIMRLFLFNPNSTFDLERIVKRTKISPQAARLNIRLLEGVRLIRSKTVLKEDKSALAAAEHSQSSKGKKGKKGARSSGKKRVSGWTLNGDFTYLIPLQSFLINMSPLQDNLIIRKFNRAGKIRLLIVAGVFIQDKDSRVDILVVGDGLRKGAIETTVKDIEAELGKEIAYTYFETKDFLYRIGMYDKLIRDILDFPHKKLINKLSI